MDDSAGTVELILCQGLDPNIRYGTQNTSLLIEAAQYDAVESAKVDFVLRSYRNYTFLVCQVLLEFGPELEYKDSLGDTALSKAAVYGSVNMIGVKSYTSILLLLIFLIVTYRTKCRHGIER